STKSFLGKYSAELCNRLRAFLIACPPAGPSPPVRELCHCNCRFSKGSCYMAH
ncbi:unnamed protein product, partial [Ilex paraguariensis]